ncbi:hypothetical protein N1F78_12140 [Seonamhaeicola sp. MEBiC1930]|uniref:hypothetical protein n=1 Tax=Seonamhaeicola sp. MEBiC01930 TaxID=2976768 RepID=UPI00324ED45F
MKLSIAFVLTLFFSLKLIAQASIPDNYKLIYSQDFEQPQVINHFEMTDPNAWRIGKGENGNCMELFKQSEYISVVRSPFNIAMIKDVLVGDFIFEIRLNQNGREYSHRDLCLMFGINNPSNFYYTHIASKPDDKAHSIFIVNDEPRTSIVSKRNNGANWGDKDSWHTVRVVRKVEEGAIEIYFDDMTTPIMEANDTHFKSGYLGFGSFDDTGKFDDIKIWAPELIKAKARFFN